MKFSISLRYFYLIAISSFGTVNAGFAPPTVYEFNALTTKEFSPVLTTKGITTQPADISYYSDSLGNYIMVYPELNKGVLQSIQYDVDKNAWSQPEIVAVNKRITQSTTSKEALSPKGHYAASAWFLSPYSAPPTKTHTIFVSIKNKDGSWQSLPDLVRKNIFNNLSVAIDENGNVLVCWVEDTNLQNAFGAYYDGKKWVVNNLPQVVFTDNANPNILINSLENGDFVVNYQTLKGPAIAYFHVATKSFSHKKQFDAIYANGSYLASDPKGPLSLVWQDLNLKTSNASLSFSTSKNKNWSSLQTVIKENVNIFFAQTLQNRVNRSGDAVYAYILNNKGIYEVYAVDSKTLKKTKIAKSKFELAYATSAIDDAGNAIVSWISKGLEKTYPQTYIFYQFSGREPFVAVRKGYKGKWSSAKSLGTIKSPFLSFGLSTPTAPIFTKNGVNILFEGAYNVRYVGRVTTHFYLYKGENLYKNTFLLQQQPGIID